MKQEDSGKQLMSIADMAGHIGISETRLRYYRAMAGFPPVIIPSKGIPSGKTPNLYCLEDVKKFYLANRDRRTGIANRTIEYTKAESFNERATAFMRMKLL